MAAKVLHIADGDSTGGSVRQALGIKGRDILTWKDALYCGPVPAGLSLRRLSQVRSRFWTGRPDEFDARDATLARYGDYNEVVLWFGETSLCQLSLAQLLDWFAGKGARLSLVSVYGGIVAPEHLPAVFHARRPVRAAQIALARRVWAAFRSPSPRRLVGLTGRDLTALPDMCAAIGQMLAEYPDVRGGVSRLERKLLDYVRWFGGARASYVVARTLYDEHVGDTWLFEMLSSFCSASEPLLKADSGSGSGAQLRLTPFGEKVLAGKADHVAVNGIDRWIGGVHLKGHRVRWRWDERSRTIAGG